MNTESMNVIKYINDNKMNINELTVREKLAISKACGIPVKHLPEVISTIIEESVNKSVNKSVPKSDELSDEKTDELSDEKSDEKIDEKTDEFHDELPDEKIDEKSDEKSDETPDEKSDDDDNVDDDDPISKVLQDVPSQDIPSQDAPSQKKGKSSSTKSGAKSETKSGTKSGAKLSKSSSEFNPYTNSVMGQNIKYDHHPELNFDDKLSKPRFARELDDASGAMTEMVTMMFGEDACKQYEKYLEAIEELTQNDKLIKITSKHVKVGDRVDRGKPQLNEVNNTASDAIKTFYSFKHPINSNFTFNDFFDSPLVNSVHMFDQDLIDTKSPRNPWLQFVLYPTRRIKDFKSKVSAPSSLDYGSILSTIKANSLAKRGVIAKEVFKHRDGLISHPRIKPIKLSCWMNALSKIEVEMKRVDDEGKLNVLKSWKNILSSEACYLICMNGITPNKFFTKYFDALISDKYSLSLMLGPLYSISWLFTPFMIDSDKFRYEDKSYKTSASISKVFTENVVKVLEDADKKLYIYDDLVWCNELFKENEHMNRMVNLTGVVYADYEAKGKK